MSMFFFYPINKISLRYIENENFRKHFENSQYILKILPQIGIVLEKGLKII